jgi:hypothetical protein
MFTVVSFACRREIATFKVRASLRLQYTKLVITILPNSVGYDLHFGMWRKSCRGTRPGSAYLQYGSGFESLLMAEELWTRMNSEKGNENLDHLCDSFGYMKLK